MRRHLTYKQKRPKQRKLKFGTEYDENVRPKVAIAMTPSPGGGCGWWSYPYTTTRNRTISGIVCPDFVRPRPPTAPADLVRRYL